MSHSDETPSPRQVLKDKLQQKGWTQTDLARILGRPVGYVNVIATGRGSITPESAHALSQAFPETTPEYWFGLETAHRLAMAKKPDESIRQRARLYDYAPVKEMEKRGWINPSNSIDELEQELKQFFRVDSLDEQPKLQIATRTSAAPTSDVTPAQIAWAYRALYLSTLVDVEKYNAGKLEDAFSELKKVAISSENVRLVPRILAAAGIRFVVVEHLPHTKLDGGAFWLKEHTPAIAMSLRYDRIDCFWHTLFHEMAHIRHNDHYSIDSNLFGEETSDESSPSRSEIEARADAEAADRLISKKVLDSFILRVRPIYGRTRIIQFANRNNIHPGIVVGQLQHRGEIRYSANRDMLVRIRHLVIPEALTDGWGNCLPV